GNVPRLRRYGSRRSAWASPHSPKVDRRVECAMMDRVDRFFFSDAPPLSIIAVRSLLALQALWILLSRPQMQATSWPSVFWYGSQRSLIRFAIVPGVSAVDLVLNVVLFISLVTALF